MNKIAFILCGQMRTYKSEKIQTSYKKLKEKYNGEIDLFITTWDNCGFSYSHGETSYNHDYENDLINENEIKNHYESLNVFNVQEICIENFDDWLKIYR